MKKLLAALSMLAFAAGLLVMAPGAIADDAEPAEEECMENCDDGGDARLDTTIILADDGGEDGEEDEEGADEG